MLGCPRERNKLHALLQRQQNWLILNEPFRAIFNIRCRELTALLHLTCEAVSDETDWTTTTGTLLLDAVRRLDDAKKPHLTQTEQISV